MFALLAQRNFFLLWAAHTISILGDYVFFIAITFWVYAQTGSAAATGAVLISSTVPIPLFAPLAGALVDRWDRRRIMLVAESARALLFLALLVMFLMQPRTLWPIYVVGFLQSALAAFFWPARSALLPQFIQPPSLLAANALYLVSDSGVRVIAPALSAFALLHLGPASIILTDAATFLLSAGCISLLTLPTAPQGGIGSSAIGKSSSARSAEPEGQRRSGQRISVSAKRATWAYPEVGLLLLGALTTYTAGTLSILLPIFVRTTLAAGPLAYGWLLTAQAVGEGAMSLLVGRLSPRARQARVACFVSSALALGALALIFIASLHRLVPALLLNALFGAMMAATSVFLLTLLQQRVANHLLGRTLAAYTATQTLAQVGGIGIASALVARIGVSRFLALDGALYLLGSGFAFWLLRRTNHSGSAAPR
jgi:MFS family permease